MHNYAMHNQERIYFLFQAKRGLYLDSDKKYYGFTHIPRISYKISLLLTTSITDSQIASQTWTPMYLQENTERLQTSRFTRFHVGFKSLPIFPIASCCFFVLLKDVKHEFLFSENLQYSASLANCTPSVALNNRLCLGGFYVI